MSRRSQNRNQYESTTTGELDTGFSVTVVSTAGLITDQDMYVVIEPDVPGQREWFKIQSITGNTLNIFDPNGRDLEGTDNDHDPHPAGSKVRSVPTQQIFEDIFSDAEDDELALSTHRTDGGDPHAQAGYLTETDSNFLYVKLVGSTMTGLLILSADPTVAFGAATKQYVDGQDHDHATPIGVHADDGGDPHAAAGYLTQTESNALYVEIGGDTMTGSLTVEDVLQTNGELQSVRSGVVTTTFQRMNMPDNNQFWRWVITDTGVLRLQYSTDGQNYTTVESFLPV